MAEVCLGYGPSFQKFVQTHIDLRLRLNNERVGPVRSDIVEKLSALGKRPAKAPELRLVTPSDSKSTR